MDSHSQIYLPKLSPVNKIIVIASVALFLIDSILFKFFNISIKSFLGLSAGNLLSGHVYSLLTYPFLSNGIFELILNALMIWLMGSEFEMNWGRKRYLTFLGTVIAGAALVYLICGFIFSSTLVYSFPLTGLSGIVSSLCVAYAVIFPDRLFSFMMFLPIKAKYFCLILVAISLYQGVFAPMAIGAWGQVGAIASGYVYMVWAAKSGQSKSSSGQQCRASSVKGKGKLTLVKDEDQSNPPKYWH